MLVLCKHCPAKIKIPDTAFDRGTPTVICPICKNHFKPDAPLPPVNPEPATPRTETDTKPIQVASEDAGWLVVHDEKTQQQTLSLKAGRQTIGRISTIEGKKADLMIETEDEYMSRQHFIISVERNPSGGYGYFLSDNSSKNRTLINKKAMNKGDEYILKDGDIIQAGLTNIVFKANTQVKNKREAGEVVSNQPKQKTEMVFDF